MVIEKAVACNTKKLSSPDDHTPSRSWSYCRNLGGSGSVLIWAPDNNIIKLEIKHLRWKRLEFTLLTWFDMYQICDSTLLILAAFLMCLKYTAPSKLTCWGMSSSAKNVGLWGFFAGTCWLFYGLFVAQLQIKHSDLRLLVAAVGIIWRQVLKKNLLPWASWVSNTIQEPFLLWKKCPK